MTKWSHKQTLTSSPSSTTALIAFDWRHSEEDKIDKKKGCSERSRKWTLKIEQEFRWALVENMQNKKIDFVFWFTNTIYNKRTIYIFHNLTQLLTCYDSSTSIIGLITAHYYMATNIILSTHPLTLQYLSSNTTPLLWIDHVLKVSNELCKVKLQPLWIIPSSFIWITLSNQRT